MMLRMRREMAGQEPQIPPQIDNLLILDRSVDLLTPLLSQLTYEGLIDEIFGINNSKSSVNASFHLKIFIGVSPEGSNNEELSMHQTPWETIIDYWY